MKLLALRILRLILPALAVVFGPVIALVARTGYGVEVCRRLGFHPLRLHYYQPIPKYEEIPETIFSASVFPGFHINHEHVRSALRNLCRFGGEAKWTREAVAAGTYTADNDNFGFSSAALLHAFIRAGGTRKVIEIGGGYSSLISMAALEMNHGAQGFEFACVEPYPTGWLGKAIKARGPAARLLETPVQSLAAEMLSDLGPNDFFSSTARIAFTSQAT